MDPIAPELLAVSNYNDLVTRNFRSTRVMEHLVAVAGVPLTRATLDVLTVINRFGSLPVSKLARRMSVDQSTVSRQIRPLEDNGLIVRTEDPADRRVAVLEMTEAGREVIQRVRQVVYRNIDTALASWSPADRELFGDLLERFRQSVLDLAATQARAFEADATPTT
jgi:DNA-binding MarR family transcriptional regulator